MSSDSISHSHIGRRVVCHESSEKLTIHIITPKGSPYLGFSFLFLWGLGYILFGQSQFNFDLNFLCIGVLIALLPLYALLWGLIGKEVIIVRRDKLIVKQEIFGVGFSQTYDLAHVSNLRGFLANPGMFTMERNLQDWGFAGGSIAFEYSGRVCRFGLILPKEDADVLVTKINQYLATPANVFYHQKIKT